MTRAESVPGPSVWRAEAQELFSYISHPEAALPDPVQITYHALLSNDQAVARTLPYDQSKEQWVKVAKL